MCIFPKICEIEKSEYSKHKVFSVFLVAVYTGNLQKLNLNYFQSLNVVSNLLELLSRVGILVLASIFFICDECAIPCAS